MRCPKCKKALPDGEPPIRCANCGWRPEDLLDRCLDDVRRVLSEAIPSVTDAAGAARSIAYSGIGAGRALAELGLIKPEAWLEWSKRLMDAAGVEYQQVSAEATDSLGVTAEPDEQEEDEEGS